VTWELASSGLAGHMPVTVWIGALRGVSAASAKAAAGLSPGQWAAVTGGAVVVLALYLIGCTIWPYGPCMGCISHRGRNRGSTGSRWGRCKRCKGSGERIRWGYRLLQNITRG
jgi:hypothetical protein